MFVRNLLQAGDHVTIIPSGIRTTLQYDEMGSLERVYVGYPNDTVEHPEMLTRILDSGCVPTHVPTTKSTTFVYGCLYTGEMYKVEGKLDKAVESIYVDKFVENPANFKFFANYMYSSVLPMSSPLTIQRWLKSTGFNTSPSYLVPSNLREDNFASMFQLDSYPFMFPRIQGYVIYRNNESQFISTNLRQIIVKRIVESVSIEGYVLETIQCYDDTPIEISYADVVNFNIHEDSILLINEDSQVVHCYNFPGLKHESYPPTVTCKYCGRLIHVPTTSVKFKCENSHCVSVMYDRVSSMLSKLSLPPIGLEDFRAFGKTYNNIISVSDILNLDSYANADIDIELPDLLYAVVPNTIVARISDWRIFCNRCNNSAESVIYYMQNPGHILGDLQLEPAIYRRLTMWLEDPENALDVESMINNPHIHVHSSGKRFDGAPIFRGKSIYITGKFMHGGSEDIKAIFTSYAADVYDKFNTAVDCVVVGDLHEGIDGKSIQRAKQMGIPIFEESEFFSKYEIDNDLNSAIA